MKRNNYRARTYQEPGFTDFERGLVMRKLIVLFVIASCCMYVLVSPSSVMASQLVWRPINPSFGGNPYNASWLMSSAQAQNKLEDKAAVSPYLERDPLEDFTNNLSRQILSRLSSQLIRNVFGEQDIEPGHYEIGGFIIDITENISSMGIEVLDPTTGDQTIIEIPYY